MGLTLQAIPCRTDNYAYLIQDIESGRVAVIDVPDAEPVRAALSAAGQGLSDILITHHHDDHIAGVEVLREEYGAKVWGAAADAHRLPRLDHALRGGDTVAIGKNTATVIDVTGHTLGHIAFHFADAKLAFTADSLMILGCGRLFEGTPAQMWDSLCKLMALPDDTLICSGHDYTRANAAFALSVDPDNAALRARIEQIEKDRDVGAPMAIAPLTLEKATNPFLLAGDAYFKRRCGFDAQPDISVFATLRARKDRF